MNRDAHEILGEAARRGLEGERLLHERAAARIMAALPAQEFMDRPASWTWRTWGAAACACAAALAIMAVAGSRLPARPNGPQSAKWMPASSAEARYVAFSEDDRAGRGTPDAPFSSLKQAIADAGPGGLIKIARGSSPEACRIEKPVTLVALGGHVRIGEL